MTNKIAKRIYIASAIAVGVLILAAVLFFTLFYKGLVTINVDPKNAIVTIDNAPQEVKNGEVSARIKFGSHKIKVEADDYVGYQEEVTLKRGFNYSKTLTLKKAPIPSKLADNVKYLFFKDKKVYYQNSSDLLFYRGDLIVESNGQVKIANLIKITDKPIANADNIQWSATGELLMIKRNKIAYSFDFLKYDFINQVETVFSDDVGDIVWSPDNNRVAYYYKPGTGERSIIYADKSNSNVFRAVNCRDLNIVDPYLVFSPDSKWLAIIPRNNEFSQNKIYIQNVYTKEIKVINDAGSQKEAIFSGDSDKLLYSTFSTDLNNETRRDLSIMKIDGNEKTSLNTSSQAKIARYFSDRSKTLLLNFSGGNKMILVDTNASKVSNYYFEGQAEAKITDFQIDEKDNGIIYIDSGNLYFVKLEGNG